MRSMISMNLFGGRALSLAILLFLPMLMAPQCGDADATLTSPADGTKVCHQSFTIKADFFLASSGQAAIGFLNPTSGNIQVLRVLKMSAGQEATLSATVPWNDSLLSTGSYSVYADVGTFDLKEGEVLSQSAYDRRVRATQIFERDQRLVLFSCR